MCLSSPKAPPPPIIDPLPPKEIFSKTALRVGNKKKAGVKTIGGKDTVAGQGIAGLRLSNYGGMNTNY